MKKVFFAFTALAAIVLVGCKDKNDEPETGGEVNIDCSLPTDVEAVDLGLPSGIKWANMNVGATKPEEYGAYFAWGETKPKEEYNWNNYFDTEDGGTTFKKYKLNGGKTTLELEDDAAHVNWGGEWRMPTKEEQDELRNNCSFAWTNNYNDTKIAGCIATSKINGNSIFFPASGLRYESSLERVGEYGYYWSTLIDQKFSQGAYGFLVAPGLRNEDNRYRYYGRRTGFNVRPVCK